MPCRIPRTCYPNERRFAPVDATMRRRRYSSFVRRFRSEKASARWQRGQERPAKGAELPMTISVSAATHERTDVLGRRPAGRRSVSRLFQNLNLSERSVPGGKRLPLQTAEGARQE